MVSGSLAREAQTTAAAERLPLARFAGGVAIVWAGQDEDLRLLRRFAAAFFFRFTLGFS
jgi:hypothetical protein